jgi:hypothetical protein
MNGGSGTGRTRSRPNSFGNNPHRYHAGSTPAVGLSTGRLAEVEAGVAPPTPCHTTMATNDTTSDTKDVTTDDATDDEQTHDYRPGGDYVDQRFIDEGRYDY